MYRKKLIFNIKFAVFCLSFHVLMFLFTVFWMLIWIVMNLKLIESSTQSFLNNVFLHIFLVVPAEPFLIVKVTYLKECLNWKYCDLLALPTFSLNKYYCFTSYNSKRSNLSTIYNDFIPSNPLVTEKFMISNFGISRSITTKDVENYTCYCFVCCVILTYSEMPWFKKRCN